SVVLRLSYGNVAMLFTGDAETETEQMMMNAAEPLRGQGLKVGHAGSRYATSGKFLEAVAPEAAIISVGAGNRYGHPAQQTLDRLQKAGVKTYRTDLNGETAIITDGNKFEIHAAKQPVQVAVWPGSAGETVGALRGDDYESEIRGERDQRRVVDRSRHRDTHFDSDRRRRSIFERRLAPRGGRGFSQRSYSFCALLRRLA